MLRLYTFQISHYAEKARWALDHKRIEYEERRLLPGPHLAVTRRLAPTSTVPILVDEGRAIQGSSAIIDHLERRWPEHPLEPREAADRERVKELERWLDDELGKPLRRVFYYHALGQRELVLELFTQRGPWWGRAFYRVAFGVLASRMRAMYRINAENVANDREKLAALFVRLDQLLDGRRYLVGNSFSRADLTLAALTAPLWAPPEHPTRWPPEALYPPELWELMREFDRHAARAHVLDTYREHRVPQHAAAASNPAQVAARIA